MGAALGEVDVEAAAQRIQIGLGARKALARHGHRIDGTAHGQGGETQPGQLRSVERLAAERGWQTLANETGAHLDIFPTLAELTGATLSDQVKQQVEGRSLLPLLQNPRAEWADRRLVHHVGRWATGQAAIAKYAGCAIQNSRFTLVNNVELYDLKADPGESKNVLAEHPDVVAALRAAYDQWWTDVQPMLVNENVVGPKLNPMKALYWKQFGGGPTEALLRRMDPASNPSPGKRKAQQADKSPK